MKWLAWIASSWRASVTAVVLSIATGASAQQLMPPYVPGEIIVRFRDGLGAAERQIILADLGAVATNALPGIGADHVRIVEQDVSPAIARYRSNPDVMYIEPNFLLHADRVPNDPFFSNLWGMRNTGQTGGTPGADIRATQAWEVSTGGSNVLVAIIDTGVDYNHPDLAANIFINPGEIPGNQVDDDHNGFVDDVRGWDFINRDNDPMDDIDHGTHVAGTVGALGDNGVGVVGVSWQVRLLPIKFLGPQGGSTADAILSVDYATLMGADIINASWGGAGFSEALRQSILRAEAAGITFVAAAGNDGRNTDFSPHYPSSYDVPGLVSVAATDANDVLASFSNYGVVSVDLAAPGVGVLSTVPNGSYSVFNGTSMATPHVAGALALVYARNPGITPLTAKSLILNTVTQLPSLAGRVLTGGRLDAFLAIAEADSVPPDPVADLRVTVVQGDRLELAWTAPGDDGAVGRASRYDVRYSTAPITEATFDSATAVSPLPEPELAGTEQSVSVRGLDFSTAYYLAMRANDEYEHASALSNVVQATTLGPPDIDVATTLVSAALHTGQRSTVPLAIGNLGASELSFTAEIEAPPGAAVRVDQVGSDGLPMTVIASGVPISLSNRDSDAPPYPGTVEVSGEIDHTSSASVAISGSGRLVISSTEEVFGSQQNSFFAGPRTRGNAFECTTTRNLHEHRFFLDPSGSTQIWFLVYEGVARVGTYQLVSASQLNPAGPGAGWYSSGPVDVNMVAGRFYLVVASFEAASTYFNQQGISPYPVPASFGSLLAGVGWDWAPPATFPPTTLMDVPASAFGNPVAYYQTLVTGSSIEWLALDPDTGQVAAGSVGTVGVVFDAVGLTGGEYDANVHIRSNDPDEPSVVVPAHLSVTSAPDIALVPPILDFGPVFVGGSSTRTLTVINRGTEPLTVHGLNLSGTGFTGVLAGFSLAPGDSHAVVLTFSPTTAGPGLGQLTASSNDPDQPTASAELVGQGLVPPNISIAPTSVSASLFTGQQTSSVVTVSNTGGSDLVFTTLTSNFAAVAPPESGPAPAKGEPDPRVGDPVAAGRGGPDAFGYSWRDSGEPGGPVFNWVEISGTGSAVPISGDDWNSGPLPLGFTFPYYGQNFTSFRICSNGWISFTSPSAQYTTFPLPSLGAPENLLAAFWADLFTTPSAVFYRYDGTRMIVEWRNVTYLGGSVPFTFQILLYPDGRIVYQYLNMGGTQTFASVGIQNATRQVGLNIAFNTPYVRNGLAIEIAALPQWLSVEPESGTIPAGGQLDLAIGFDASGMAGGDFNGSVIINSNDPVRPRVSATAHLHVNAAPDIALSRNSFDFPPVFLSLAATESLTVQNVGALPLNVSGITSSHADYTVQPSGAFTVGPGQSLIALVTFRPSSAGPTPGTLTLACNDPDESQLLLPLTGTGVVPPDILVSPTSFSEALLSDETTQRTLTVSNTGSAPLEWTLTVATSGPQPALGATPTSWQELGPVAATVPRNLKDPGATATAILARYEWAPETISVLLYSDDPSHAPGAHWADLALQTAGLPYTAVYNDPLTFGSVLNSRHWDLLVINHENFFAVAEHWNAVAAQLAAGAHAVISTFDLDGSHSPPTTLWSTLGLSSNSDLLTTSPVYWWDPAHRLFHSPESVPPFSQFTELFSDNGDRASVLPGRETPAGFVVARQAGQSAIVIAADRSAIVNTFVLSENNSDLDGDSRPDAVELLTNEISFLLQTWLTAEPSAGTVAPDSSADVTVTFDARQLPGGDYVSSLDIVSNDPDEASIVVPVSLHVTAVPDISVEPDSLDYGPVYLGLSVLDTLSVSNTGQDVLIVSAVTLSSADYSVAPTGGFSLPPGQSRTLVVTFQPVEAGPRPGTLVFDSNDPNEAQVSVTLSGTGVVPPDIVVTPTAVAVSVGPGRRTARTVTVQNTGGSDLVFTALAANSATATAPVSGPAPAKGEVDPRVGDPVAAGRGGPDAFGYRWVDSNEPGGPVFNWVEISGTGTPAPFSGDDWNHGPVPLGFTFPYYGQNFTSFRICSNGWISFTSPSAQFSTFPLPSLNAPENLLAAFWADLFTTPSTVFYRYDGTRMIVEWRNVTYLGGSVPFTFQILLYPSGRIVYQYLDMGGTQTFASVGIQDATRQIGLNIAFNTPYVRNGLAIEIAALPEWLSVEPAFGTIPAGGQLDLALGFDAAELAVGDYNGRLLINSNDPDELETSVAATLHVVSDPILEVSATALAFGETFVGFPRRLPLSIRNVGVQPAHISSITAGTPEFTVELPVPFVLASGESTQTNAVFAPTAAGTFSSTLTIASDALEAPHLVTVDGFSLFPPVVDVTPNLLRVSVPVGRSGTGTLHVCNTGASVLRYGVRAVSLPGGPAATLLGGVEGLLAANTDGRATSELLLEQASRRADARARSPVTLTAASPLGELPDGTAADPPAPTLGVPGSAALLPPDPLPPPWILIGEPGGELAPGACADHIVQMDGTPFAAGDYFALLYVESNDPARPIVTTVLQLHVTEPVLVQFDLKEKKLVLQEPAMHARVEASVRVPAPYTPGQIDVATIRLNGTVTVDSSRSPRIEQDRDGPMLVMWFRRADVLLLVPSGNVVPVTITGDLATETLVGHDSADVRRGRVNSPHRDQVVAASQPFDVAYEVTGEASHVLWVTLLASFDGGEHWTVQASHLPNSGQIRWLSPSITSENAHLAVVEVEAEGDSSVVQGVIGVSERFALRASLAAMLQHTPTRLLPVSPNPSSVLTPLAFAIAQAEEPVLEILDLQGRLVRRIRTGPLGAGNHRFEWDGRDERGAASGAGIYFVRLHTRAGRWSQRFIRMP